MEKTVFVTVGTTSFDSLIRVLDSLHVHNALRRLGYKSLLMQIGRGSFEPEAYVNEDFRVDFYRYKDSLKADLANASLVISHAGAGSCMETLAANKPLIVVINQELMHNHQVELAHQLAEDGHAISTNYFHRRNRSMFNKLTCNYRKCRKMLDHYAIACSCSHIFCEEHCPTNFGGTNVKCLACKSPLSQEKMDIIPVDLNPNEKFKSMVLAGQKPEIIMDICSRALAFWMYQSQQEIDYNLYISKKLSDQCRTVEEDGRNLANLLQREKCDREAELQRVNKKCEEWREKLIELSQRNQRLELEIKASRAAYPEPSCPPTDSALGASEKKRPSHGFTADLSFRSNQGDPQLKRSHSQTMHNALRHPGSFQKPFFGVASAQHRFASPDSTRASPAYQPQGPPAWNASQLGSSRSDPGSASIAGRPAVRRGNANQLFAQRSAISSAFGCVPVGMKS